MKYYRWKKIVTINDKGFLQRKTKSGKNNSSNSTVRDWWLIKNGSITINKIFIGHRHDGKRYKIKIILLDMDKRINEENKPNFSLRERLFPKS